MMLNTDERRKKTRSGQMQERVRCWMEMGRLKVLQNIDERREKTRSGQMQERVRWSMWRVGRVCGKRKVERVREDCDAWAEKYWRKESI